MNQNFPHLSLNDNIFCCSLLLMFFPLFSLCCLSASALIKHGVAVEQSSSRAEEKGSNSTSQDGTVTHNGPAILSAPHRFPTESPLLRQLFNRLSLIQRTHPHAHAEAHADTCVPLQHKPVPVCLCVCMPFAQLLTLLRAF